MLKYFLLVFLCFLYGCCSYECPPKPKMLPVKIICIQDAEIENDGYYISYEDSKILQDNIRFQKQYIEQMENIIQKYKE